jgi:hypothetical protein
MRLNQQLKINLIVSALVSVGFYLACSGWYALETARLLKENSATTEGRLISSSSRALSAKGGQSSQLVLEYKPENFPALTKEFDVDGDDYRKALSTRKATVTYLRQNPQVSRVTEFASMPYQILTALGACMILAGLFCFWHSKKRKS